MSSKSGPSSKLECENENLPAKSPQERGKRVTFSTPPTSEQGANIEGVRVNSSDDESLPAEPPQKRGKRELGADTGRVRVDSDGVLMYRAPDFSSDWSLYEVCEIDHSKKTFNFVVTTDGRSHYSNPENTLLVQKLMKGFPVLIAPKKYLAKPIRAEVFADSVESLHSHARVKIIACSRFIEEVDISDMYLDEQAVQVLIAEGCAYRLRTIVDLRRRFGFGRYESKEILL